MPDKSPSQILWDFDHEAVVSWDSDVLVASTSALNTAIKNAMTAGAGHHRIVCTFTNVAADTAFYNSLAIPSDDTYILIQPDTTLIWDGELRLNGPTNCKWINMVFQVVGATKQGVESLRNGVGIKHVFHNCKGGHLEAGLSNPAVYATCFGNFQGGTQLKVTKGDYRRVREVFSVRDGKYHFTDNFVTECVDDFLASTVRGGTKETYVHATANIVLDTVDDPAYLYLHPDFLQSGTASDEVGDQYIIEAHENIFIGSTIAGSQTQGLFASLDTGAASGCIVKAYDDVILTTSQKSLALSDKRSDIQGVLLAMPPCGGRLPTGGDWPDNLEGHELWFQQDAVDGASATPVLDGILCSDIHDQAGWGVTPNNLMIADFRVPLGGPTSYDTMFPNMTGLVYDTDQVVIPAYSGNRDRDSVRQYIAHQYQPPGGWAALNMTSPDTWGDTVPATGDTQAPTVPTNVQAVSAGQTAGTVTCDASTDDTAVTGYRFYVDGVEDGTSATPNYTVTGLAASTTYTVTVSAYDAAGNESAQSAGVDFTTDAVPDTQDPTVPANLLAASTGTDSGTANWSASIDNVAVTGYRVYLNGVEVDTTTELTYGFTGLLPNTGYVVTVSAYDAAGNESAQSSDDSFTTDTEPAPVYAAYLTAVNIGPADTQLFTLNTETNPDQWEGEGGSPILPKP
ncbi:MAG: fibronectin type III domain-containing protein [Neptuniibacter sp.]